MKENLRIKNLVTEALRAKGKVEDATLEGAVYECSLDGNSIVCMVNVRQGKAFSLGRYSFTAEAIKMMAQFGTEFIAVVASVGNGCKIIDLRENKPTISFDELGEVIKTYCL